MQYRIRESSKSPGLGRKGVCLKCCGQCCACCFRRGRRRRRRRREGGGELLQQRDRALATLWRSSSDQEQRWSGGAGAKMARGAVGGGGPSCQQQVGAAESSWVSSKCIVRIRRQLLCNDQNNPHGTTGRKYPTLYTGDRKFWAPIAHVLKNCEIERVWRCEILSQTLWKLENPICPLWTNSVDHNCCLLDPQGVVYYAK